MLFVHCLILFAFVCGIFSETIETPDPTATCPISLPQDVPWDSQCYRKRQLDLISRRYAYRVKQGTKEIPFNRLETTPADYKRFLLTDPFLFQHALTWRQHINFVESRQAFYLADKVFLPKAMNMSEFQAMRKFFKTGLQSRQNLLKGLMRIPSDEDSFNNDIEDWISDKYFAEQRLAGTNPMTLQKITIDSEFGMPYEDLKKIINPTFEWTKALYRVLEDVTDVDSVLEANADVKRDEEVQKFAYEISADGDGRALCLHN
ncbi:hypothetical protein AC249_AIPGENE20472 [Exaiptasia diaphana]|nr:hypothetical protein AC249_AIPGENE20472 [Exaiptasia diaphana]